MRYRFALLAALASSLPTAIHAQSLDKMLAQLAPEERARQVCILRGFDVARKAARLRGADRIVPSTFGLPVLEGTSLTAKGGAVRLKGNWYAMSFTCQLTADLGKATSFDFTLGKPIARDRWEELGLWK